MIRQPDFLTEEHFERFLEQSKRKRPSPFLKKIRFEHAEEGLSCQMMHIGSFDDEPESFTRMEAFCLEHGYIRSSKIHREIYLSDPRKTEPAKLKTVLRFPVKKLIFGSRNRFTHKQTVTMGVQLVNQLFVWCVENR